MQVVHGSSHERFGKKAEEQEGVAGAPRRSFWTYKAWSKMCRSFSAAKTTGQLRCTDESEMFNRIPSEV